MNSTSNSIWFFDIDDTLINTADLTEDASKGIVTALIDSLTSEQAESIAKRYTELFLIMMHGYCVQSNSDWEKVPGGEAAFQQLYSRFESCQKLIVKKYGEPKKFSREVFIKLAAEDNGIELSNDQVTEAADGYWSYLSDNCSLYPGVDELFQFIKSNSHNIYFITSSDARLSLNADGQFEYNPKHSEAFKRGRIEKLREKGLVFDGLSIGDPEDKPSEEFFEKGINLAKKDFKGSFSIEDCVMVGDSFKGDLETPQKLGFKLVVLYDPTLAELVEVEKGFVKTGNLSNLISYLS